MAAEEIERKRLLRVMDFVRCEFHVHTSIQAIRIRTAVNSTQLPFFVFDEIENADGCSFPSLGGLAGD